MIIQPCGEKQYSLPVLLKSKIAFLDRDGVINKDTGYVGHKESFKFESGIRSFLYALQNEGYSLIIVTNQSGIGRGLYTKKNFLDLTNWYTSRLKKSAIHIDITLFCPHAPTKITQKDCRCRKPNSGMLEYIIKNFKINPKNCIMVGDRDSDMHAARNVGVTRRYMYGKPGVVVKSPPLMRVGSFDYILSCENIKPIDIS